MFLSNQLLNDFFQTKIDKLSFLINKHFVIRIEFRILEDLLLVNKIIVT
jgi:hypothetical protein